MSDDELNQAILGGQLRESRELKLPRMITHMMGHYLGAFSKGLKIENLYPLLFDTKSRTKKANEEEWEKARERWRKIDEKKGRI